MKLSDYVARFISAAGVKHVFGVTGGAVVHLFDSLARYHRITPIFTHHEQSAAFAAEANARIRNGLGACLVTTGPGGTNALTGLLAAWMDSIPCIFISGQARYAHTTHNKPIRQLGVQEFNIVNLVSPITKFAVMLNDPKKIKYYLQKAVYIAKHGRPGPVWIDIPLDFQWAEIVPEKLPAFYPIELKTQKSPITFLNRKIQSLATLLTASKKPLVLGGAGIRLAHAENDFIDFINYFKLPFVSSWNASDIIPNAHPLNLGRIGMTGQRGGNNAVQNCDLLISIGSHLCYALTRIKDEIFAPYAKKVIVDIDPVELNFPYVKTDLIIQCDTKIFLQQSLNFLQKEKNRFKISKKWRESYLSFRALNKVPADLKKQSHYVNPYVFIDALSNELGSKANIVVDGGGTALFIPFQAWKVKTGQRLIVSAGISAMGTGLPESIGASFASMGKQTICIIGDGSLQLNVQELQTIVHHELPIKIMVFNNSGYLAIRHTQGMYLDNRFYGTNSAGGLSFPKIGNLAKAYGLKSVLINSHNDMKEKIRLVLREKKPVLCEIKISPAQQMLPVL